MQFKTAQCTASAIAGSIIISTFMTFPAGSSTAQSQAAQLVSALQAAASGAPSLLFANVPANLGALTVSDIQAVGGAFSGQLPLPYVVQGVHVGVADFRGTLVSIQHSVGKVGFALKIPFQFDVAAFVV